MRFSLPPGTGALGVGLILVCSLGLSSRAGAQTAKSSGAARGAFRILVEGKEIGREEYEIEHLANEIRARARLVLDAGGQKVEETASLTLSPTYEPRSYEWKRERPAGQFLRVQFEGPKASLEFSVGGSETEQREFLFENTEVTILDNNFFHHYLFLVRRYDFTRGGPQPLRIFIPQEALPALVTLDNRPGEGAPTGTTEAKLRQLRLTTEDNEVWLWVDENGELVRLTVPLAKVEVLRVQP